MRFNKLINGMILVICLLGFSIQKAGIVEDPADVLKNPAVTTASTAAPTALPVIMAGAIAIPPPTWAVPVRAPAINYWIASDPVNVRDKRRAVDVVDKRPVDVLDSPAVYVGVKSVITLEQLNYLFKTYRQKSLEVCVAKIIEKHCILIPFLEAICDEKNVKERRKDYRKLIAYLKKEFSLYDASVSSWLRLIGKSLWTEFYNYWYNTWQGYRKITEFYYEPNKIGKLVHIFIMLPVSFPIAVLNLLVKDMKSEPCDNNSKWINNLKNGHLKILVELATGISGSVYFLKKLDDWNAKHLAKFLMKNLENLKKALENQKKDVSLKILLKPHYSKINLLPILDKDEELLELMVAKSGANALGYIVSSLI